MSAEEREHLYESVGNSLPVGRVGEPHDIAQAYLFLMQEGFGTGHQLWLMVERSSFE
jgi:NAD(P)-dependent dehydrogenase (short-subunit alcohol dehydrogenase family)